MRRDVFDRDSGLAESGFRQEPRFLFPNPLADMPEELVEEPRKSLFWRIFPIILLVVLLLTCLPGRAGVETGKIVWSSSGISGRIPESRDSGEHGRTDAADIERREMELRKELAKVEKEMRRLRREIAMDAERLVKVEKIGAYALPGISGEPADLRDDMLAGASRRAAR